MGNPRRPLNRTELTNLLGKKSCQVDRDFPWKNVPLIAHEGEGVEEISEMVDICEAEIGGRGGGGVKNLTKEMGSLRRCDLELDFGDGRSQQRQPNGLKSKQKRNS